MKTIGDLVWKTDSINTWYGHSSEYGQVPYPLQNFLKYQSRIDVEGLWTGEFDNVCLPHEILTGETDGDIV